MMGFWDAVASAVQAICTSFQTDKTPTPHHSIFYRPDAKPTVSKHCNNVIAEDPITRNYLKVHHLSVIPPISDLLVSDSTSSPGSVATQLRWREIFNHNLP